MPVCSGCGASFEDTFQFCPHCGRSRPKPQEIHLVTREEIPPNACPICRKNDRVEKISAIYSRDTHQISGSTTSTNTYVDKDGYTRHETRDNPFSGTQQSNLASFLTPPKQPEKNGACFRYLLIVPCILFLFGGILGVFMADTVPQIIVYIAIFLISAYGLYWIFSTAKKKNRIAQQNLEMETARWNKAMGRWQQTYYCHRDDVVFLPGEQGSVPAQNMLDFLYR